MMATAENGGNDNGAPMSRSRPNGANGNGSGIEKKLRNKIALSSLDESMIDAFGSKLPEIHQSYQFKPVSIDSLTSGNYDFYVIDLPGLDTAVVREQIIKLREIRPDSEVFLLASKSMMGDPLAARVRVAVDRYLVSRVNRPEAGGAEDYNQVVRITAKRISKYLNKPLLLKIGGSIWDLVETNDYVLQLLVKEAKELHNAGYPIGITNGGGPRLNIEERLNESTGVNLDAKSVLLKQANDINDILGGLGQVISPKDFQRDYSRISGKPYLKDHIPIIYLSGENIKAAQSDAHTLTIGDKMGSYKLIFAKDTKGVYQRDPNKPGEGGILRVFLPSDDNKFIPVLYADQAINDIDRRGRDGRGDHLVETDALVRLQQMNTKNVRAIQIVDGKDPKFVRYAAEGRRSTPDGDYVGSFILRGEAPRT